jgi:hypothetical protein
MAKLALTIAGGIIGGLLALPSGGITVAMGGPTESDMPLYTVDDLLEHQREKEKPCTQNTQT